MNKSKITANRWIPVLLLTLLTVFVVDTNARNSEKQQETITGTITDAETGQKLPGVNILVKGTTTGTSTDAEGNYELTVSSLQDTLVFSFIGYRSEEHTSELQSRFDLVCRLLLETKKN